MSEKEKPTDECISGDAVKRIHEAMLKSGLEAPLNDLTERESALGAYVIFSGHQVSETVRISGAPPSLVAWVKESVMAHAMVCIEAQRQAHYDLWREFTGDFPSEQSSDKPDDGSKGDVYGG